MHFFLTFFLFLLNFKAMNLSFANNSNHSNIIYIGGGSMSSSPGTTGTTSVPSTRYATPSYGSGFYLPFQYRDSNPLTHYFEKRMEKNKLEKEIMIYSDCLAFHDWF